jgi:hypothetical protein
LHIDEEVEKEAQKLERGEGMLDRTIMKCVFAYIHSDQAYVNSEQIKALFLRISDLTARVIAGFCQIANGLLVVV